jgi:hypothetical protein
VSGIYIVRGIALALVTVGCAMLAYVSWFLNAEARPWVFAWAKIFLAFSAYDYARTVVRGVLLLAKEGRQP